MIKNAKLISLRLSRSDTLNMIMSVLNSKHIQPLNVRSNLLAYSKSTLANYADELIKNHPKSSRYKLTHRELDRPFARLDWLASDQLQEVVNMFKEFGALPAVVVGYLNSPDSMPIAHREPDILSTAANVLTACAFAKYGIESELSKKGICFILLSQLCSPFDRGSILQRIDRGEKYENTGTGIELLRVSDPYEDAGTTRWRISKDHGGFISD